MTPYIESDDVATGRDLARVVLPLDGLNDGEQPESFAGFITVDKAYDSNMFFWFVPATVSKNNRYFIFCLLTKTSN